MGDKTGIGEDGIPLANIENVEQATNDWARCFNAAYDNGGSDDEERHAEIVAAFLAIASALHRIAAAMERPRCADPDESSHGA